MKVRLFLSALPLLALACPCEDVCAWGSQGHAAIGQAAVARVSPGTRAWLHSLLGAASPAELDRAIADACFWPDTFRGDPDWAWSAPLHYVNIPREAGRYDHRRDCPGGRCVTEGIKKFADELGHGGSPAAASGPGTHTGAWRSFAWVCHLVGDLHQPLHAGFADDRGGNRVQIEFRGERINLHRFWDGALAADRLGSGYRADGESGGQATDRPADACPGRAWRPDLVDCWTDESHVLAAAVAYPPGRVVSAAFADQSWSIVREQWWRAADRLALLLDTLFDRRIRPSGTAGWRKPGKA